MTTIWPERTQAKASGSMADAVIKTYGVDLPTMLAKVVWEILKRPLLWVPPALVGGFIYLVGPIAAGLVLIVVLYSLTQWSHLAPESFDRVFWNRLRTSVIKMMRYELGWKSKVVDCKLHKVVRGRPDRFPKIVEFHTNVYRDLLLIKMVDGQTVETYQDAVIALADAFEVIQVRVAKARPKHVWLTFKRVDLLDKTIPAFPISEEVDLTALPVGYTDEGEVWTIPATHKQGAHLLSVATTGGGKSSLIWCMIRAMAPMIRDGVVQIWICDPKGGLEFDRGNRGERSMWHRYVEDDYAEILSFLKAAVREMDERARRQKEDGGSRNHVASVLEPLIFLVIDEILSITAFETSARRTAIQALIAKLLTKGRAVGITVAVCSQDATKAFLQIRQFFPRRWAGRLMEPIQVDMVLGDGARDMGARCDDDEVVPYQLPGVGFVAVDGVREPVRTRAAHVTEEDIDWMVLNYSPSASILDRANELLERSHKSRKILSEDFRRTSRLDHEIESWKRFFEQQLDSEQASDTDSSVDEDEVVGTPS